MKVSLKEYNNKKVFRSDDAQDIGSVIKEDVDLEYFEKVNSNMPIRKINPPVDFDRESLIKAIILSEVLGAPKGKRLRRRR